MQVKNNIWVLLEKYKKSPSLKNLSGTVYRGVRKHIDEISQYCQGVQINGTFSLATLNNFLKPQGQKALQTILEEYLKQAGNTRFTEYCVLLSVSTFLQLIEMEKTLGEQGISEKEIMSSAVTRKMVDCIKTIVDMSKDFDKYKKEVPKTTLVKLESNFKRLYAVRGDNE